MDGRGSSGTVRKRGHQHHIRHDGMRRSNVPADEIIAALRDGNTTISIITTNTTFSAIPNNTNIEQTHPSSCDMEMNSAVDNENNNIIYNVNTDDSNVDDVTMLNADDNSNNNTRSNTRLNLSSRCAVNNVLSDSTNEWMNEINVSSGDTIGAGSTSAMSSSIVLSPSSSTRRNTNNNRTKLASSNLPQCSALHETEKCATKDYDPDQTDSVSSGSSTTHKKSKSKRDSNTKKSNNPSTLAEGNDVPKKEKRKRTKVVMAAPNEERPPLEGAAATDQWNEFDIVDIENDPEAAEWLKLRCTSERTEVVAEREYRRQNRRCADYPGLAFGRSIFSSDTMMKLNIIRNELHNIMKTQLKRVRNKMKRVFSQAPFAMAFFQNDKNPQFAFFMFLLLFFFFAFRRFGGTAVERWLRCCGNYKIDYISTHFIFSLNQRFNFFFILPNTVFHERKSSIILNDFVDGAV